MAVKKKAPEAEKENGERWLVSYADFMTLLLGLFIILYSMVAAESGASGNDSGEGGSKVSEFLQALSISMGADASDIYERNNYNSIIDIYSGGEGLSEESESAHEEKAIEEIKEEIENLEKTLGQIEMDSIEVIVDEIGVNIRIKDTVLFKSGSYTISKDAEPIMRNIGDILRKLPNNKIQVKGHTDNVPINTGVIASNWELGALRAVNVTKLLIKDCALNPTNITATSYGEFYPIDSNSTVEGKAKNRRVEITILRNYPTFE